MRREACLDPFDCAMNSHGVGEMPMAVRTETMYTA